MQIEKYLLKHAFVNLQCYEFNKFVGFSSEEEAVSHGVKLLSQNRLWAVIIFEGEDRNDSRLDEKIPSYTTYKIR